MKINDALRAKLNVLLTTGIAFAAGLGVAAQMDLPAPSFAAGDGEATQESVQLGSGGSIETPTARSLSEDFARVAHRVTPAVVTVQVEKRVERSQIQRRFPFPFNPFGEEPEGEGQEPRTRPGTGSGFVIRPSGYIVTNNHVVENAEEITVQMSDRQQYRDVEVVGGDPTTDVALLKVDAEDLPAVSLGSSDSTRVGEWVLAVGNPGFGGGNGDVLSTTVTAGIVSGKGRSIGVLDRQFRRQGQITANPAIEDFIQTDAAINPGNSGGPLVNMQGEVVGVNTAIASETGYYVGYGFAVPIELVEGVVQDLIQHGEVRRAALGVAVQSVSPGDAEYYGLDRVAGAIVTGFSDLEGDVESPAQEAGVRQGDVIVAVEGRRLRSVSDLQRRIRSFDPGETVEITVVRRSDRERETIEVELGRMGAPGESDQRQTRREADGDLLGLDVRDLSREIRAQLEIPSGLDGVLVTGVDRGSPGARAGIGAPALILDINGRSIESTDDYDRIVDTLEPGTVANLRIYLPRQGVETFVSVRIPAQ